MRETIILGFLFLCGAISILITMGIVYQLGKESLLFFNQQQWQETNKTLVQDIDASSTILFVDQRGSTLHQGDLIRIDDEIMLVNVVNQYQIEVTRRLNDSAPGLHQAGVELFKGTKATLVEFFTKSEWNPQIGKFGIWSLVNATLMTSLIASFIALPLGLGVAIYLSEYASAKIRNTVKPVLEVLAGIPTVVYGYFALTFITPLLRSVFGSGIVEIYNTASAGIVIGILILPLVSSMSEDALRAVPRSRREASFALGATKLETAVRIVVPAALSGVTAAFIVAISRAIGETMIVAIAAGAGPSFTFNPFEAAETMTGHIVRISGGDLSYDSLDYNSIFAIGLMLFLITLTLNIISQQVVRRFRQEYE